MVTPVNERTFPYYGLSTDVKPIENVGNGSTFYEMDTRKVYLFDEENKRWLEQ